MLEVGKKYSRRLLYKMMKFYNVFSDKQKVPTLSANLTWSHYDELLYINDFDKIKYYIMIIEKEHLTIRELREKIKSKEYERLDDTTKMKLINKKITNNNTIAIII